VSYRNIYIVPKSKSPKNQYHEKKQQKDKENNQEILDKKNIGNQNPNRKDTFTTIKYMKYIHI